MVNFTSREVEIHHTKHNGVPQHYFIHRGSGLPIRLFKSNGQLDPICGGEGLMDFINKAVDYGKKAVDLYEKAKPYIEIGKKAYDLGKEGFDVYKKLRGGRMNPFEEQGYGMRVNPFMMEDEGAGEGKHYDRDELSRQVHRSLTFV